MNFRDHHRKELGMCPKGNQAMEKYQAGEGARGIRTWIFPFVTTEVITTVAFFLLRVQFKKFRTL